MARSCIQKEELEMTKDSAGHFEILGDFPPDVVAVAAHGHLGREDYVNTLVPLVEKRISEEGRINLYYEMGADFSGFSAGAAWNDARLGLLHLGDFARVAVVTDVEWVRLGVKMFAPLMPAKVHLFHLGERDQARKWISDEKPGHAKDELAVSANHKLKAMEDKAPPAS